jgi:hypothetical protein
MNPVREFIESLKKSGATAEDAFRKASELYVRSKVDAAMKELYPEFTAPAEKPVETRAAAVVTVEKTEDLAARSLSIVDICTLGGCSEKASEYIRSKKTVEEIRAEIVDAKVKGASAINDPTRISKDAVDKFREIAVDGLSVRAGLKIADPKRAQEVNASGYRGKTLYDLCRECLELKGESTRIMDKDRIIARAMASGDFPYLLSNTANKYQVKAVLEAQTTYQKWTGVGQMSDFKSKDLIELSGTANLREVKRGAAAKFITMSEAKETAKLLTYSELFAVTRQDVYDDNLSAFTTVPYRFVQSGLRTANALAYAVLTDNATMADGHALFKATVHKNLGTAGAISNTTIGELHRLLADMTDGKGNNIHVNGKYFLCNTAKVALAKQYLLDVAMFYPEAAKIDSYRGMYEIIFDADINAGSATPTNYYLVGDPNVIDTVIMFYLNGQMAPEIFQEESRLAEVDGIVYKVRWDVAAKAPTFRGMAANLGA